MTNRRAAGIALVALAQGLAGCSGSGSRSPLSPSSPPAARSQSAASVSSIAGFVLDTGFRPLAGVRVEVVDGSGAGASTTSDVGGGFSLTGTFTETSTFRASKDGYVTASQTWNCSNGPGTCPANGARPWLGFYLNVLAAPVDIAGDYTLTFVADGACSDLPTELRTRTYAATIAPSHPENPVNTSFGVAVEGATFLGSLRSFSIGVAGDYLGIWMDAGEDPPLVEQVAPRTYLAFSGLAAASKVTPGSPIAASFDGWIEYCVMNAEMGADYNCGISNTTGDPIPGASVVRAHCESKNHQLILTRR
jgi:carboxypeptidase family protein